MKLRSRGVVWLLAFIGLGANTQNSSRPMTVEEVVQLALENHSQLKLAEDNVAVAHQQTQVAELQRLPSLTASANVFYLGDALLLDKNFSKVTTLPMPHFGNNLGVQASQLLFKGGGW